MLRNGEAENNRILEKYGDIMTESERNAFFSPYKKVAQQEAIKEHKDLGATISDWVCCAVALALATLMGIVPLFLSANSAFPVTVLTLLMILSPWGCLLLSWNQREEWIFYVIRRSALDNEIQKKDRAPSKHPYRDGLWGFFITLTMIIIIIFVCVILFISPQSFREYRGNPGLLFALFPCLPGLRGGVPHAPYLSDLDSRGPFKKMYSIFTDVAPFIFSYWLFTALPDSLSASLTGIAFLGLLILAQGAWALNWIFVALLSVYSFLCELPDHNTEKGKAVRNVIRERYRARLKERKEGKILPIGRFAGAVATCLLVAVPFIRMKNYDNLLFFRSTGLIAIWLIFLFFIIALVRLHITEKLRCYALREESEPAAIMLDEKLLARQYKSLKIAAWFLLAVYLTGGVLLI